MAERGLSVDHVTVWRWVQRYAPELDRRLRKRLLVGGRDVRAGERQMGVLVSGGGLERCDDRLPSFGQTRCSGGRALSDQSLGRGKPSRALGHQHRQARCLSATIVELKAGRVLEEKCTHRPVQYLNNVLEQDHWAIKRRVRASQHFRSFWGAWRTIAGYEAIHMIRKGQAYGSAAVAKVGLLHRFILGLLAASN